jgi:hypothetical protein
MKRVPLIIGAVAVVLLLAWAWSHHVQKAKTRLTAARIARLHTLCHNYQEYTGKLPTAARWKVEILRAVLSNEATTNDDVQAVVETFWDGWGQSLVYKPFDPTDRKAFMIYSIGSNGTDENGNGDDVLVN